MYRLSPRSTPLFTGKIFCIGFPKTGTTSIGRALRSLSLRVRGAVGRRDSEAGARFREALSLVPDYDAFQDLPWPLLYRELDAEWPGSKFILTVRPADSWLQSVVGHFGGRRPPIRELVFGPGCADPVGHERQYVERYLGHNEEVREYFADRRADFLEMDLTEGHGWDELCPFLDAARPFKRFPHANRRVLAKALKRVTGVDVRVMLGDGSSRRAV